MILLHLFVKCLHRWEFTAGVNKLYPVRNISKDKYLDIKTGEIKNKKKSNNRYQSPKSVRKSINRLMDLIRCNATDYAKCKWLTLTYADVMTDGNQAYLNSKLFLRRLERYLNKSNDLSVGQKFFKYIAVPEPQGETHGNSWHLHILLIFEDIAPFIDNDTIANLWSHGITSTKAVFDADGLALYFKSYLSDIEYEDKNLDDENAPDTVTKIVNGVSKKFIKGERLKYYPKATVANMLGHLEETNEKHYNYDVTPTETKVTSLNEMYKEFKDIA